MAEEKEKKPAPPKASAGKKNLNFEEVKRKLRDCQKLRDEYLAGWQRARADFLNYKKRELEKIAQLLNSEKTELILKMLAISDNFERASRQNFLSKSLSRQEKTNRVIQGFLQIKKQFEDFLRNQGVEEIKAEGEKFDPNFHQAIEEMEVKGKESGEILEVVQKGYKLKNRVIRPVKVKVAR